MGFSMFLSQGVTRALPNVRKKMCSSTRENWPERTTPLALMTDVTI